jgi:hypothetical protein
MDKTAARRLRRVTALIKANAQRATPGRWWISHSHVIANGKDGKAFDVACQPWRRDLACYGVNPGSEMDNMRHIATCYPEAMIQLADDIDALLSTLEAEQ